MRWSRERQSSEVGCGVGGKETTSTSGERRDLPLRLPLGLRGLRLTGSFGSKYSHRDFRSGNGGGKKCRRFERAKSGLNAGLGAYASRHLGEAEEG